ncbi:LOW QUALITY PROTEIN: hypothetical protein HID58_093655 [Brassica napus]|uniref:Uncharacterized protein n=1 Tax=Brassica napus TaxID=3708 RepID=A0ABQ7XD04_BRANA|nr:LOW QUALITY PROTEIN: hypothetical protein HID58_093655 [Brassica napus]
MKKGVDNYRFYINFSNRSVICHCLKFPPELICLLRSCSMLVHWSRMRVFLPQVLILLFISFLIPKHLIDRAFIDYALPKLLSLGKCPYDHIAWLTKEYLEWGRKKSQRNQLGTINMDFLIYGGTKLHLREWYFSGPKPHESNRGGYLENMPSISTISS